MSQELATIDTDIAEWNNRLAQAEAAIDSVPVDQLGDAMQWIREQQALLRARKQLGQLALGAKRLEAKILQRLGRLEETTPGTLKQAQLTSAEKGAARFLAELTAEGFADFLSFMEESGKVSSDVSAYRRQQEELGYHAHIRAIAEVGQSPSRSARDHALIRESIEQLIEEVILTGDAVPSNEIVVGLAELVGGDPEDPVDRAGLNHLASIALGKANGEGRGLAEYYDGASRYRASVPAHIAIHDGEWVRVPWRSATVAQFKWAAEYWEVQADSICRKANEFRQMASMLNAIAGSLRLDDEQRCEEILVSGRRAGLVRFKDKQAPRLANRETRFPKLYEQCESGGMRQAIDRIVDDLEEFGFASDDELAEDTAEALATRLFTGANISSMEAFATAYCPSLCGKFMSQARFGDFRLLVRSADKAAG